MAAIERVAAYQWWPLRGVPLLYPYSRQRSTKVASVYLTDSMRWPMLRRGVIFKLKIHLELGLINNATYRIAGKFGGELNLALWRIDQPTAKIKIRQYLIRV